MVMNLLKKVDFKSISIASFIFAALLFTFPNLTSYIENIGVFDTKKFLYDYPIFGVFLPWILIIIGTICFILFLFLRKKELIILGFNDVYNTIVTFQYKNIELILEISNFDKNILILALKKLYDFKIRINEVVKNKPFLMIICSLPFATKFGYYFGNYISNFNYLHYNRRQNHYLKLKEKRKKYKFFCSYIDNNSKELFVAVQSSFLIDINNLDKNSKIKTF